MASCFSKSHTRSLYEMDSHAWAAEQADALRSGRLHDLDLENLAEEIAEMGRTERKELRSELVVILLHMLNWDHQQSHRSKGWANSIEEHRDRVVVSFEDSPSLKSSLAEILPTAYKLARRDAHRQTGLPESRFPLENPYSMTDIMERKFVLPKDDSPPKI